jgi:hypothetical protein
MKRVYQPTIKEVKGDQEWSALEIDLLRECKGGFVAFLIGRDDLPHDQSDPDRRIRAGLIRYLMLGGCDCGHPDSCRPNPVGVSLKGGWIDGELDMQGCTSRLDLSLHSCLVMERFVLRDASVGALYMDGCRCEQTVDLHRLKTTKNVHLRHGFVAEGGVDLAAAKIGRALDFMRAKISTPSGEALNIEGAQFGGSVFILDAVIEGRVLLSDTTVGGSVLC